MRWSSSAAVRGRLIDEAWGLAGTLKAKEEEAVVGAAGAGWTAAGDGSELRVKVWEETAMGRWEDRSMSGP